MAEQQIEAEEHAAWVWLAAAAGTALGLIGLFWLLRYRNPVERMNRLLRRCQDRIRNIESSLAELESALGPSSS